MRWPKDIRFWRGARRNKPLKRGNPPIPRGKRPFVYQKKRLADPIVYLKLVIATGVLGLFVLPFGADMLNFAVGPKQVNGCRVVSVTDGDTIRLWCPGRGVEKARLVGFDTPEVFNPKCDQELLRGTKATWALRRILFGATEFTVVWHGTDRYGRALIYMAVDGVGVAQTMISQGHARYYSVGRSRGWC